MKQEDQNRCYLCKRPAQGRCISCGRVICEQDTRTTWTVQQGKVNRCPVCDDQQHQHYIARLNQT